MGKASRRTTRGDSRQRAQRQYRIKGHRRERPDVAKLGKAALELAMQQAAMEAEAEQQRHAEPRAATDQEHGDA